MKLKSLNSKMEFFLKEENGENILYINHIVYDYLNQAGLRSARFVVGFLQHYPRTLIDKLGWEEEYYYNQINKLKDILIENGISFSESELNNHSYGAMNPFGN